MADSEEQEKLHFQRIVHAFKSYRHYALKRITERESYLKELPAHHQTLLESYKRHLEAQRTCVEHNVEIIKLIVKDVESLFENVKHDSNEEESPPMKHPLYQDMEKVMTTIRQIVRDWSPSGEHERNQCYEPIIKEIEHLFPSEVVLKQDINILVPGAGLGRLAYELAKRGYSCQGNEFSLFMLFASNFVLNRVRGINSLRVYPWVHSGSNTINNMDQIRQATFPDVDPSDLPPESQFSMTAGDFLEVYNEEASWDCVATCFFIDCANNIVEFIEAIHKILKPGGYWVNLGPLLYHFADQAEDSIEPSYEEIKTILTGVGFKIIDERLGVKTAYTQNARSMLKYEYESVFFVARKAT